MKFEIISKIQDFKPSNAKKIREAINYFNGKQIRIIIEKLSSKRSLEQNSFFHLLMDIYSKEMIEYSGDRQYTPAFMKDMCKSNFLTVDVIDTKTGEIIGKRVRHTSELNKEETSVFWDEIIQDAAQRHGIVLPYPSEKLILEFDK